MQDPSTLRYREQLSETWRRGYQLLRAKRDSPAVFLKREAYMVYRDLLTPQHGITMSEHDKMVILFIGTAVPQFLHGTSHYICFEMAPCHNLFRRN